MTQIEAIVESDGVGDDIWRKSVTLIGIHHRIIPFRGVNLSAPVFDIDISVCPLCGGTLRVIADFTDPEAIQTILAHLKQRAQFSKPVSV
ncbi:MAG: hypothetical protein QMC00_07555 [Pseudomonadales bacterium]